VYNVKNLIARVSKWRKHYRICEKVLLATGQEIGYIAEARDAAGCAGGVANEEEDGEGEQDYDQSDNREGHG
jgi:hypothetical protein